MSERRAVLHHLCQPLAQEFQRDRFGLSHRPVDDFLKSQWQRSATSVWWLVYRWCLALCFCVGVLGSLVQGFKSGLWFIYLTDWGFFLCLFTSLFGAIIVSIHHWRPKHFEDDSCALKLYWVVHWSTLVLAVMITFLYWIFIYPSDNMSATALYNLWAHGFNSILMVLDHMLVAFPTRLLHFVYPFTLALIYGIFSVIYYFAGGVDIVGHRYIYPILDWSRPGLAMATVVGSAVLICVSSVVLFGLYKLRSCVHRKCNSSKETVNV